ncbi:fatty-acid amide hydrolase 2-B isoform X1 [Tribolium castaneum]|nr:PREDICTED: fatty-acid amide hydrolase 2-B isoform X1 [Tribolium castaneum]|eukprot:XP_975174.1 PREDICTED: fatty-acid amide hydrolase 2-B isoform X1 [Tribolium castaneum]
MEVTVIQKMYPTSVKLVIWTVKAFLEVIYAPLFLIRLFKKPRKCPPITNKLLLLPATELAKRIRKKQIPSTEVVKAYIARIEEVNPIINAVLEARFERALQEAKQVDKLLQETDLSEEQLEEKFPLLGVPISIKGSIAVAGMIHSAGRVDHNVVAPIDAIPVRHVKGAGAIPLLTSNVPELCMNWETKNKRIGRTANPYNSGRTCGGSSGGEASLIGCGASLLGLGSDIAGSLRLPAHYCGVWGHKPSPHVVSSEGHYPDCKNKEEWNKVFTIGPMARYASDLKILLNIVAEPDARNLLKLNETVDVKKIKIYYMEEVKSPLPNRLNSAVISAIERVRTHFDILCDSNCTKVDFPRMKHCTEASYLRLLNIEDVDNIFEGSRGDGVYLEILRYLVCQSKHEFTSIGYGFLRRNIHLIPPKIMNKIYKYLDDLRNDFLKILKDNAVVILPTCPCEATHHGDVLRKIFNPGYLSIFNALGFPVTNCPVGFNKNGLPIGIQVVAAPNCDRLTLAVAEELEKAFGGWKFN